MAFDKLDKTTLNAITSLADKPNKQSGYTAADMKQKFTDNAETIADFINNLIDYLAGANASTTYGSGAKNIGVSSRSEFSTYTNVEDVLVYFRELIRQAVAGEIGDGDIKTRHLDPTVGTEAVTTATIRDGAVTNAKLAGGITYDKIVSVLSSALSGTISNDQLAGSITYDKLVGAIRASQLYGEIPADKLADSFNVTTFANKLSGAMPVSKGGTGGTTAAEARTNIEAVKMTVITNPTFTWASGSGITDFPYKGTYTNSAITANTSADVIFGDADCENFSFSKRCTTDAGHLYIYCDVSPTFTTTPIVRLFD